MTMEKSVNVFGLFIVLSLLIIFNEYINVQIIEHKNFKCFLIHSINTISIVRFLLKFQHKKVSIVQDNLITLNLACQTATYDQTNRLCFLFNGSNTIGQLFNDKVSLYPRYFYNKIFFDSTDSRLV